MIRNVTEGNSKIIEVWNSEVTRSTDNDDILIKFIGDNVKVQLRLDFIGYCAFRRAFSNLIPDFNRNYPYIPLITFACHYRRVFVGGIAGPMMNTPVGTYVDPQVLVVNPAFIKIPAKSANNDCTFADIDDDGLYMYCPVSYHFQRVWIAIDTSHSTLNAFGSDVKYIVLEFRLTIPSGDDPTGFVPAYNLRNQLDKLFPEDRRDELDAGSFWFSNIEHLPIKFKPYEYHTDLKREPLPYRVASVADFEPLIGRMEIKIDKGD